MATNTESHEEAIDESIPYMPAMPSDLLQRFLGRFVR